MIKRILIDCTCINSKMDGLSQYAINIIKCLADQNDSSCSYSVLLRSVEHQKLFGAVQGKINFVIVNVAPIGLFRDIKLSWFLYRNTHLYDLVYFISNQYPIFYKGGIYTIHDIIYETFPEQLGRLSWLKRLYLHFNVRWGVLFSDSIIAVSSFTKRDVVKCHKLNKRLSDKIHVVYEGWEHMKIDLTMQQIEKPFSKYLFYVGSSRGHKNLSRLLQAIALIEHNLPREWGVVIVGKMNRLADVDKSIIECMNKTTKRVHLTGWVTDEELAGLFKNADAFVFPSLSEGFGIPVLESFYWGVPILCSDNTVFPEIAGDSALYFNPLDTKDIADKIIDYVNNSELYKEMLVPKGKKRLDMYSWSKAAEQIKNVLMSI